MKEKIICFALGLSQEELQLTPLKSAFYRRNSYAIRGH